MITTSNLPACCKDCRCARRPSMRWRTITEPYYECRLVRFTSTETDRIPLAAFEGRVLPAWCPLYNADLVVKRK